MDREEGGNTISKNVPACCRTGGGILDRCDLVRSEESNIDKVLTSATNVFSEDRRPSSRAAHKFPGKLTFFFHSIRET
jgi:hypothetical protein